MALQDAQYGFVESRREQVRLQEELSMKEKVLRHTQIRNVHEMREMKRAQEQQIEKVSEQKLGENHEKIQQLTSQLQQMQKQMNSVDDSGDFQDVEPNFCGRLSHVSSQPVMIPSARTLLSRDKRLLLDRWIQSGLQENVFGNPFSAFDSPTDYSQKKINLTTCKETEKQLQNQSKMKTRYTSEDRQNQGTIPMPTFETRPLTMSSAIPVELPQNYMVGQLRQQISELQFDKFPDRSSFLAWKFDSKHKSVPVLIFHRMPCCGSIKWRWLILWTR